MNDNEQHLLDNLRSMKLSEKARVVSSLINDLSWTELEATMSLLNEETVQQIRERLSEETQV